MPDSNLLQRKRYATIRLRLSLVKIILPLATTFVILFLAQKAPWPWTQTSLASSHLMQILRVLLALWAAHTLVMLPLQYFQGFRLEHRFGLSKESRSNWIKRTLKGETLSLILFIAVYGALVLLRKYQPDAWWITGSILGMIFFLVLGKWVPMLIIPLFYKMEPLDHPILTPWWNAVCKNSHIKPFSLMKLNLGKETRKANAAIVGLGQTRRMLISDTLLEKFETDEIQSVMAHELGHHVHRDMWSLTAISTLGTWLILWSVHRLLPLGMTSEWIQPSAAMEIILLTLLIQIMILLSGPIYNALSRVLEHRADHYALMLSKDPESFARALERLGDLNLADPKPSRLAEILLYDHPPIYKRIRHARALSTS